MVFMNKFSFKEFCKCGRSVSPACPRGEQLDLIAKVLPVTSIQRTLKSFSYFCSTCAEFFNKYIISDKRAGGCLGRERVFQFSFYIKYLCFKFHFFFLCFILSRWAPQRGERVFNLRNWSWRRRRRWRAGRDVVDKYVKNYNIYKYLKVKQQI